MKYWYLFWNNLSLGWKRIHYLGLFIVLVFQLIVIGDFGFNLSIVVIIFFYMILVSIVRWIIEGFNENK